MNKRDWISFCIGLVLVSIVALLLSHTVFGVRLNRIFTDKITDTTTGDSVVVVGIDDRTLATLGAWPFTRDIFANVTKELYEKGARLVVYDVLFLENRRGDDQMRKVLASIDRPVIFASKLDISHTRLVDVYNESPNALSAVANVYPDDDGKVRNRYLNVTDRNGTCLKTISYQAYVQYIHKNTTSTSSCDTIPQQFIYPEVSPTTFSLIDVLNKKIGADQLNGKVVFIGSVSLDLDDHFISNTGDKIAGVYIHAAMFSQLLHGVTSAPVSFLILLILLLLVVIVGVSIPLQKLPAVTQYGVGLLGIIIIIVVGFIVAPFGISFPFSGTLFLYIASFGYAIMFRYTITEKRSNHIRKMFSKYVHAHVLEQLLNVPELVLGGEKRHMSILFSDLRGFTTLSESLDPKELTTLLNSYFSAMMPEILEEKGTIDKFIGDAIMAFWNAPLLVPDYCTHSVRSALRMQKALTIFNEQNKTSLAIGIGIHAGEVIVGNVGSHDHVSYTVLGDSVNLASRVEGLTKKYGVECLVTGDVKELVHDASIAFRKLDVITVKGKSLPTILYEARYADESYAVLTKKYEEAFGLYSQERYPEALVLFNELSSYDEASRMMIDRIVLLSTRKDEGTSFDGIWRFDEK